MLLQQFMGEKFGRDNIWEGHLATELWTTQMDVRAVLDEQQISLKEVLNLQGLSRGVYFLKLVFSGNYKPVVFKLVKQ